LRNAVARLEDAVQRPLLGDFDALPVEVAHSAGTRP
jgi:hypothetical protein